MKDKKIVICGNDWTIKFEKDTVLGYQNSGLCDCQKKEITIYNHKGSDKYNAETYNHELLHAIFDEMGQFELNKEVFVETLAKIIYTHGHLFKTKGGKK